MRLVSAAILDGYNRKKDKTVSLRFVTQEMSSHEIMQVDQMCDQFGILYFRTGEGPIEGDEMTGVDEIDIDSYDNKKTQSQRLRAVLFLNWKRDGEPGEFDDYYKTKTEQVIAHFKNKLDD